MAVALIATTATILVLTQTDRIVLVPTTTAIAVALQVAITTRRHLLPLLVTTKHQCNLAPILHQHLLLPLALTAVVAV